MSEDSCIIDGMDMSPPTIMRPRLHRYQELPSRPWFLAPPLRIGSKLDDDVLTMYTVQSRAAYEMLSRDGAIIGDSTRGWPEFQEAYAWMLRQMDRRLPGQARGGLLWLWPTVTRRRLCGNARQAHGDVLLTVRAERVRVLLSEFIDWHAVLNRRLHVPALSGESDEGWEARWNLLDDDFSARAEPYRALPIDGWPDDLRAEIESSWEAIFDPKTWHATAAPQATMRELRAGDVIRAVRIR